MSISYNFLEWIGAELPGFDYTVNGYQPDTPDEVVHIKDNGGPPQAWINREDHMLQIVSRNRSNTAAESAADDIYTKVEKRFSGLLLPEATIDGKVYPERISYQMSPIQLPSFIGVDERGLYLWSFNLKITTE